MNDRITQAADIALGSYKDTGREEDLRERDKQIWSNS